MFTVEHCFKERERILLNAYFHIYVCVCVCVCVCVYEIHSFLGHRVFYISVMLTFLITPITPKLLDSKEFSDGKEGCPTAG